MMAWKGVFRPGPNSALDEHDGDDDAGNSNDELQLLAELLHFPEEVALRLTDTEYRLFYQVPPVDYLRQVTLDLDGEGIFGDRYNPPNPGRRSLPNLEPRRSVRSLIKRFNQVSEWVVELINSHTGEKRKVALGRILRVAVTCWNIGNFNGAMEIVAGLKSQKLSGFWHDIGSEPLPALDFLSAALISAEYEHALGRALAIPECRLVPFFGAFIQELREILSTTPVLTRQSTTPTSIHEEELAVDEIRGPSKNISQPPPEKMSFQRDPMDSINSDSIEEIERDPIDRLQRKQVFIASANEEGQQSSRWTRGPDGLVNLERVYKTQAVMDHIATFHQHHHTLTKTQPPILGDFLRKIMPICDEPIFIQRPQKTVTVDFEYEALYEVEKCGYCPVQPLPHDHGVTMFPLVTRDGKRMDKHILQIMQHGTTCVVGAGETDWPGAVVHLRLERGASVLSWCKTGHTPLKHGEYLSSTAQHPELSLSFNPEEVLPLKFRAKLSHYSQAGIIGNEGFIDLEFVKDMRVHGVLVEPREITDMTAAARKSGLEVCEGPPNMVTLVYGRNLSDNRTVHFLLPLSSFRIWAVGLHSVMRALIAQAKLPDRSLTWLKNKYIGLYYEDGCCSEPLVSDAIRVFGGKIASSGTNNTTPARRSGAESRSSLFKKNMSTPEFKRSPLSFCSTRTRGYQAPRHSSYSSAMSYFRSSAPRHSSLTTTATNIMVRSPNSSGSPSFLRLLSGWTRSRTRARDALQRLETSERFWQNLKHLQAGPVGYETQLNFLDFVSLFRSFSLVLRTELRELFEQLAAPYEPSSNPERSQSSPELHQAKPQFRFGIQSELSGMVMGVSTLRKFCETRQEEIKTDEELIDIVQRHEPDPILRADNCLSFEGFVRYICDKDNYAFLPEQKRIDFVNKQQKLENNKDAVLMKEMTGSLSQYFIASSHNTYLIGHQLKGESSTEIYSQVLLSGCRCVELDCWDGDDGNPVIYHGHTFTSKISFRRVVETIARSAFVTSPYPIILSIENHCSVPQQQVMANIFEAVFGDKLVTNFLFDSDYSEEPKLPSPEQLKYKVLIKNKKLPSSDGNLAGPSSANQGPILPTPNKSRSNIFSLHLPNLFSCINPFKRRSSHPNLADDEEAMEIRSDGIRNTSTSLPEQGRTNCISSPQSNSANNYLAEDSSDEEYDEDDELDGDFRIPITETEINKAMTSAENRWCRVSASLYAQWKGEGGGGRKGSNQIAKELSDMIVYVQAVKYRGLKPLPPKSSTNQSTAEHEEEPEPVPGTSYESSENCDTTNKAARTRNTPQTHHPCYSCTSMSEPFIRRVARRNPSKVVAHTESQLIRTYPAAMRIDSSNTDPTQYWAYGVQLVALNYQTDDPAMSVNTAMYESNALTGYVRKPSVMWDPNHIAYRRFNPMSKEFDGVHANYMFLGVISGQYVAEHIYSFYNSFVVVEVLGVPADYTKVKTKVTQKNALNPLWNDNFHFKINFPELAFIRFEVFDADTNYKLSQRVIKLSCLEPGYRHVKLKTPNNQHLNMASLLIYSRRTEEFSTKIVDGNLEDKKLHFLVVHGVTTQESYSIFKVTEDTTAAETIEMCLGKSGFYGGKESGCVLVEEIASRAPTQRVLADHEKVLKVATSKHAPKLLLKRVGNDPSSRAWLTSIGNASADRSKEKTAQDEGATALDDDSDDYYVCVYNVSPEIPYAIIKIPLFETASYLIEQALTKARCEDDPKKFVLVEEMEKYTRCGTELVQRTLADNEIVYFAQAAWKNLGKFSIQERGCTVPVPRHRAAIAKIQRGLSITRGAISASTGLPLGGYTEYNESKLPIPTARTEPTKNSCRRASTMPLARGITRAQGHSAKEMRSSREDSATNREVHSDGETAAGGSMGSESMREHVARFKRLSLRRLRGWRS